MGIAVYMGDGKYCSLPLSGYKKWNWSIFLSFISNENKSEFWILKIS
jgi:hypothetical protein